MLRFSNWRSWATALPIVMLTAVGVVACRDMITSNNGSPSGRIAHAVGVSAAAMKARDAIHDSNRNDWVGVAHNRMMQGFLVELNKPGKVRGSLCDFVADFASQPNRVPIERRFKILPKHRDIVRGSVAQSWLCRPKARLTGGMAPMVVPQGGEASELFRQIDVAVDAATSSYDLANRLHPILNAGAQLGGDEAVAVETAVSVAQNSYEYWEANFDAFAQTFANEYGSCAQDLVTQGWSPSDAVLSCTSGNPGAQVQFRRTDRPTHLRSVTGPVPCGPGLTEGFKRIGKADLAGAWSGFWAGIFVGNPVAGALLSSAGASMGASLANAAETWICLVQR